MKAILLAVLLAATMNAQAGTAFLIAKHVQGMTQMCVYDYLGSVYTITISAVGICPFTIEVE